MTNEAQSTENQASKPAEAPQGVPTGNEQQTTEPTLLERAEGIKKFIEEGESRIKKLLEDAERKFGNFLFEGRTSAGQLPISQAEKDKQEADKIVNGFFR